MGYANQKLEITNELTLANCYSCGTPFGIERLLHNNLRDNHGTFYCPLGHTNYYPGLSEAEKLKKQLAETQTKLYAEMDLRLAADNQVNRLKRRVGNGTCPCCKRTFKQLSAHMEKKHPDFKKPNATKIA